jgi:two-component system sensor histidine kinase KdpD
MTTDSSGATRLRALLDAHPYPAAFAACALAAALLLPLHDRIALVNVAMLLLLVVAGIAARLGRGPAVLASVVSVAVFDVGFVPPRGSFTVHDAEYLIVFAVMLVVALLVSQISGRLRASKLAFEDRERRQRALYQLAAALSATLRREQVVEVVDAFLRREFDAVVRFHPPDDQRDSALARSEPGVDAALRTVEASGQPAQFGGGEGARPLRNLQPLLGATRARGVLETALPALPAAAASARHETLAVVAGLMAAALERLHYLDVAARSQVEIASERLRNTLLASLSHDLRTPLTVLYARADALRESLEGPGAAAAETLCEEVLRANRLCESLLDLARLRSPVALLQRDWIALEELVGAAIASLGVVRGLDAVELDIAADLPWLRLDVLMFERVLANLIDNALKQGGPEQSIRVGADVDGERLRLRVGNSGSRFPEAAVQLLEAFARGEHGDRNAGFGIGLAVCKAVVDAHGGRIALGNRDGMAEVTIELPLPRETMPSLPEAPR